MQVVVLSGVSGSGKSVALRALEDAHFFSVDNLPADLIPPLIESAQSRGEKKVAISADARSRDTLGQLPEIVSQLRVRGHDVRVIFLDSTDESLVRRFSETRRTRLSLLASRKSTRTSVPRARWRSTISGRRARLSRLRASALMATFGSPRVLA